MNALASMDTLEGMSKPCESLCFVSDGCSVRLAARSDGAVESGSTRDCFVFALGTLYAVRLYAPQCRQRPTPLRMKGASREVKIIP